MELAACRRRVDDLAARRRLVVEQVVVEEAALGEARARVEAAEEARRVVQEIAQALQQRAHGQIARVVTRCLGAVFDDPYEFRIDFEQKRGRTEAKLVFVRDGLLLADPLNEVGGGVIDVAGLALRLACIMLSRPPCRRLVVLDEPWKNVRGGGNKSRTREMLLRLAEDLGVQFVLTTDVPEYQLGKVVEMGEP